MWPAADTRSAEKKRNPLVEIVTIVVAALLIAFVVQLRAREDLPHPERLDGADARHRPARAREPHRHALRRPVASATSSSSTRRRAPTTPARRSAASPTEGLGSSRACSTPTPQRSDQTFIKRVVGVGGDRIQIRDGHVDPQRQTRGGRRSRTRAATAQGCTFHGTITVPDGSFFLMGDNRGQSDDSRFWGPVPKRWVIGTAIATYWPPKRIGVF